MNFIKVFIYYLKKKYGYLAQRFTKENVSEVSKGVQNKCFHQNVYAMFPDTETAKKIITINLEKCLRAYAEEEKANECHTTKRKKRIIKRKTNEEVRTLRKHKKH